MGVITGHCVVGVLLLFTKVKVCITCPLCKGQWSCRSFILNEIPLFLHYPLKFLYFIPSLNFFPILKIPLFFKWQEQINGCIILLKYLEIYKIPLLAPTKLQEFLKLSPVKYWTVFGMQQKSYIKCLKTCFRIAEVYVLQASMQWRATGCIFVNDEFKTSCGKGVNLYSVFGYL